MSTLSANDSALNGRWNLEVPGESRLRAWWLEVNGAGGAGPLKGRFVGAPGGDMNDITDLAIENGELRFSFVRNNQKLVYRARIVSSKDGEMLNGEMKAGERTQPFRGRRAPVIKDRDDGSWKAEAPIELFNGRDLSGWRGQVPDRELGWVVKDGVLMNTASANNLVSDRKFWNFALRAEYRVRQGSNSGIGLRARYEVQILDDVGREPNTHTHGALYSRIVPAANASKPPGEWQTLEVRFIGREVTITLNGRKLIDRGQVEGLTAVAVDADESAPGPFLIQGDHREVEFRKFTVTPLVRK